MQVQALALRTGLIRADGDQPFTPIQVRVVQVGAVLNAQHCLLGLHSLNGALPVRLQDAGHGNGRVVRLVDEPVVGFGRGPVSFGDLRPGLGGVLRLGSGERLSGLPSEAGPAARGALSAVALSFVVVVFGAFVANYNAGLNDASV